MKFRDGYWSIKENFKAFHPAEPADSEISGQTLTVYAAVKRAAHRGDTLNAPLLTLEFSSPLPDIIHVRIYHHKGGAAAGPVFELPPDGHGEISIGETEKAFIFSSASLSIKINKSAPFEAVFTRKGKKLTEMAGKLSGYFLDPGNRAYMVQYLGLSVGEAVYGLGERFTALVKNGQSVDIWNEDGGTSSEQAYKNVPFYMSSRGYGVFVNNPGRVSFEAASEVVTAVQFSVPGEVLDYYLIAGDSLQEVLGNYTQLTGRPALPPAWSFGLWLSTSFTTNYDEKTVTQFIDGMAERNIPLGVFHFDCFWMKEYQWVDFEWDKRQFPDPAAMLKRLKARGLKICVWINPYIAQKSRLFDEGMEKGYLVKRADGSVWQWDRWQAGMALVDFTNPAAAAWFRGKLKTLLDMGVDTFKTDFGERIPLEGVYYNGADPEGMHNYYTHLYNKTVFGLLEEVRGKGDALVFARSATAGGQRFPLHWGGDCSASYESMAETLRGGLSLTLSGFSFWSHDISGFEQTATADLFKRWVAFGLLSSHSRLHGNESYRVPWNFDEESNGVLRFFVCLKCSLMPYLYRWSIHSAREGVPLMRAMVLEYPDDPACTYLDRQYFLGDSLLAAPVFSDDGKVSYYLPEGRWTNFLNGEVSQGGRWKTEAHSYLSLPLMVKSGSVIPVGADNQKTDYDYEDGITFHVFDLADGDSLKVPVPDIKGNYVTEVNFTRRDNVIQAEKTGGRKPWKILLRGIHQASAEGAAAADSETGFLIQAAGDALRVKVTLGDI
ncbi:MAG: alpha-xylosidase [Treponema sp.]|jgi:alpha-D-xyloside xylohydrolase|nr:alpha-xylosidase [Treponema sp.]